jgi:hypothetical protein
MKRALCLLAVFAFHATIGFPQAKPVTLPALFMYSQRNNLEMDMEVLFYSAANSGNQSYNLRKKFLTKDSIARIASSHTSALVRKNASSIVSIFDNAEYLPIGGLQKAVIGEYTSESGLPGLYITGIQCPSLLNKVNSTAKQRASTAIEEFGEELFQKLYDDIKETKGINSVAVQVLYLVADFSESDKISNSKTESVILSVPISKIRDFANSKITDKQFIAAANVYLADSGSRTFKKIQL